MTDQPVPLPPDITAFIAYVYFLTRPTNPVLREQARYTLVFSLRRNPAEFSLALLSLARGETVDARDNTFIHQAVHYLALYGIQCDSLGSGEGFTAFTLSESLR